MELHASRVRFMAWLVFLLVSIVGFVALLRAQVPAHAGVCEQIARSGRLMCLQDVDDITKPGDTRIPVILIHGWDSEHNPGQPNSGVWAALISYVAKIPWFTEKYRLYQVTYWSNITSVRDMAGILAHLVDGMDEKDSSFNGKPLVILGHSMGGLLARSFMQEQRLAAGRGIRSGDRVLRLITLATPHHGSPVANGPARDDRAGVLGSLLFDYFDDGLFGGMAWAGYNRFDLHWDNYDQLFDYKRFFGDDNVWLRNLNVTNPYAQKLSVYGGIAGSQDISGDCAKGNLNCLSTVMTNTLGILQNDGVVPFDSAIFSPCLGCVSSQTFLNYDHYELATGKSTTDSNLFGAIAGDLSDLVADGDKRFDDVVEMGDMSSEPFHNLRGWGSLQNLEFGPARNQPIRGRSSFDLFIDEPRTNQTLLVNFATTGCDDSFDLYIGQKKIWSYVHKAQDRYPSFATGVDGQDLPKRRVTLTFVNKATDACGYAPIYSVGMIPGGHA